MNVEQNNTEEVLSSLSVILEEYDVIFASFISLSRNNILKSKKNILVSVKRLVEDTLTDVILLKNIVGKDNSQYIQMINDIYKRVYDGVMLVYHHEFNDINNSSKSRNTILNTSFTPYVNILTNATNNISNIDCEIKQRLNLSLDIIKNNSNNLEDFKQQLQNRSFGEIFRQLISPQTGTDISLQEINKEQEGEQESLDSDKELESSAED